MTDGWTRLRRQGLRPTRRAWLQLLLGGLLYVAGANVGAGWVVALAGIILGVVPWAAVSAWRQAGAVEVRRTRPSRVVPQGSTDLGLEVRSRSVASVVVHDELAVAAGTVPGAGALWAQAAVRRGVHPAGTVRAIVSDVFGLVRVTAVAELDSDLEVTPAVPRVALTTLGRDGGADVATTRSPGGTEVVGVREYVHGDPVRHVHWRSTARTGELVVRELASAGAPGVRVRLAPGTWDQDLLDLACDVACGVAASLSADRPAEIAADGVTLPWGPRAQRHLAYLPPHWGAPGRQLRESPAGPERTIDVVPSEEGTGIERVDAGKRTHVPVGADIGAWLGGRG